MNFFLFVLSLEMILEFVVFWRLSQFRPESEYLSEISFYFLIGSGRIGCVILLDLSIHTNIPCSPRCELLVNFINTNRLFLMHSSLFYLLISTFLFAFFIGIEMKLAEFLDICRL